MKQLNRTYIRAIFDLGLWMFLCREAVLLFWDYGCVLCREVVCYLECPAPHYSYSTCAVGVATLEAHGQPFTLDLVLPSTLWAQQDRVHHTPHLQHRRRSHSLTANTTHFKVGRMDKWTDGFIFCLNLKLPFHFELDDSLHEYLLFLHESLRGVSQILQVH